MQTSNINIFNLFQEQITDYIELLDDFECNIVSNAFKLGNAQFIKNLYANQAYRYSTSGRSSVYGPIKWMRLATVYYYGHDFLELFQFLTKNDEVDLDDENITSNDLGQICLVHAMNAFDYECVKNLYQSGVSLDFKDVESLYNRGISPFCPDMKDFCSWLHYWIQECPIDMPTNYIKIIELLMDAGINFFEKNIDGETALDYARSSEDDQLVQILIMTPLIYAIKKCSSAENSEYVKILIDWANGQEGKIESYRDSNGKTALDYAQELNLDSSIIEALQALVIPCFSE